MEPLLHTGFQFVVVTEPFETRLVGLFYLLFVLACKDFLEQEHTFYYMNTRPHFDLHAEH